MSELLENPEKQAKAKAAIAEYQHFVPHVEGHQMVYELEEWLTSCEGASLEPPEQRQFAWMHIERAVAEHNSVHKVKTPEELVERRAVIGEYLLQAEKKLATLIKSKTDTPFKSMVEWELTGTRLLRGFLTLDQQLLNGGTIMAYTLANLKVLETAIEDFAKTGGVSSYALVHATTLTSFILRHSSSFLPLPTPPRMRGFGVDSDLRSDLVLLSGNADFRFAFTDQTDGWQVQVGHDILATDKGHFKDSIMVALDAKKELDVLRKGAGVFAPVDVKPYKPNPVADSIGANAVEHVKGKIEGFYENQRPEREQYDDPFEWYWRVSPGRQPYIAGAGKLEEGLSKSENSMAEGSLSLADAQLTGWMYAEAGLGRAIMPLRNVVSPKGDFERAEDMFSYAYENNPETNMDLFDALFAHAAMSMYEAVATGEEPPFEHYATMLATFSESLLAYYATLDKSSQEAVRADEMIQQVTACLLFADDPTRSFVVVPSAPRQRQKWQLAVWQRTVNGFVPQEGGRIAIAETDSSEYAHGVVGVTPKLLGHGKQSRVRTLCNAIDQVMGTPGDGRELHIRKKELEKAYRATVEKTVAAVN
jgi:hypothetical protein